MKGFDKMATEKTEKAKKPKLIATTFRIDTETHNSIVNLAKLYGLKQADIIRYALSDRLQDYLGNMIFIDPDQGEAIERNQLAISNSLVDILMNVKRIGVNVNQIAKDKNTIKILRAELKNAEEKKNEFDKIGNTFMSRSMDNQIAEIKNEINRLSSSGEKNIDENIKELDCMITKVEKCLDKI